MGSKASRDLVSSGALSVWTFLQERWALGLVHVLHRCGSLGKLVDLFEPQFPYLPKEVNRPNFRK